MTRGTLFLILKNIILETVEFNGDMYPEGHGEDVIKMLDGCNNEDDFKKGVDEFNKENFNYEEDLVHEVDRKRINMNKENAVVMTDDNYFQFFFSDWTFWKNLTNEDVKIITKEKEEIILKPNEQVAIRYGHFEGHYKNV